MRLTLSLEFFDSDVGMLEMYISNAERLYFRSYSKFKKLVKTNNTLEVINK